MGKSDGAGTGRHNAIPTADPNDNRFVFVERKIHHQDESSTKDRFKIERRLLPQFMLGTLDIEEEFKSMVRHKELKKDELERAVALARSCQLQIVELGLKPQIRTVYYRTAFQQPSNNDVRLTLDTPLYMFRERTIELSEPSLAAFWEDLTVPTELEAFEYGVLEVKTSATDPPDWVEAVVGNESVVFAGKFSKFQHGVAANLAGEPCHPKSTLFPLSLFLLLFFFFFFFFGWERCQIAMSPLWGSLLQDKIVPCGSK
jgi:SPX domain protein involved in polyphosphate accumulation